MVADAMVKEALANPWLGNFTKGKNREPVVIVGTVLNKSHEHINVQTFVSDLERELTNSQRVTFVAGKGEREEVRDERREQAVHAREDTQKAPGKEMGADYMMRGASPPFWTSRTVQRRCSTRSTLKWWIWRTM